MSKKIRVTVSIVLMFLVGCMAVHAEESTSSKHYLELSISDGFYLIPDRMIMGNSPLLLESMYEDAEKTGSDIRRWMLPPIGLKYYYQVLPWLQVGGEVSAATCALVNLYDPTTFNRIGNYNNTGIYLTAGLRFTYYQTDYVQLYSGLSAGVRLNIESKQSTLPYNSYAPSLESAGFIFQATAFGVRFGKQVYGFVELGYGYKSILSVGIGTRF